MKEKPGAQSNGLRLKVVRPKMLCLMKMSNSLGGWVAAGELGITAVRPWSEFVPKQRGSIFAN